MGYRSWTVCGVEIHSLLQRAFFTLKQISLEAASTHKSEKIHAGNVFVTHDLDLLDLDFLSFGPKINRLAGFIVEHFYFKFGDPV